MPVWLTHEEHAVVEAAAEVLAPAGDGFPGARAAGVTDYIDGLLGAFETDPPRIWAGGPFSGRHGDEAGFESFLPLGAVEELAWRIRIEGSRGIAERERNGPVRGWQETYREGIAALGPDFAGLPADEQQARLDAVPELAELLYRHTCEGLYADPVYGGNRDFSVWQAIAFEGDVQPRGYTDAEVSEP